MDCYQEKINEYKKNKSCLCSNDPVIRYVMEQKPLENAIKTAAQSVDKAGKRHSHQRRIKKEILENFSKILVSIKIEIENAKNFEELFETIKGNKINGAGELLVYDTALRIGHFRNIFPEKIYLHSGTRAGIKNLLGEKTPKGNILKKDLPEPFCFCDLMPYQLEDFFCVYKDAMRECAE